MLELLNYVSLFLKQLQKNNTILYSILDDVYCQKLGKDTNILL